MESGDTSKEYRHAVWIRKQNVQAKIVLSLRHKLNLKDNSSEIHSFSKTKLDLLLI